MTPTPSEPSTPSMETFFNILKVRTTDPVHVRLIAAARRGDPGASMENELNKVIVELLDET